MLPDGRATCPPAPTNGTSVGTDRYSVDLLCDRSVPDRVTSVDVDRAGVEAAGRSGPVHRLQPHLVIRRRRARCARSALPSTRSSTGRPPGYRPRRGGERARPDHPATARPGRRETQAGGDLGDGVMQNRCQVGVGVEPLSISAAHLPGIARSGHRGALQVGEVDPLQASAWVAASTTGGATPARCACAHRLAHRHQRSPGRSPGKPNSGRGVTSHCRPPR